MFPFQILNSRLSTRCAILLPRVDFSSTSEPQNLQRLSKLIADRVAISRREAERLIRAGDVTLAGTTVRSPQLLVDWKDLQNSALVVQGKVVTMDSIAEMERKLGAEKDNPNASSLSTTRVWLAHKLAGELVSEDDPYGRPSLLQRLARGGVGKNGKQKLHLKPVGRLDMPTEGLILLTNDGKYARELELPASMIHRVYRVRAHGNINDYKIAQIQRGITIEGVRYSPMKVQLDGGRSEASNKWLKVTCAEGKNRQIRKVFKHLGSKCCGRFNSDSSCSLALFLTRRVRCHFLQWM